MIYKREINRLQKVMLVYCGGGFEINVPNTSRLTCTA